MSDEWSLNEIRSLMTAPVSTGTAATILHDEIEASSWRYPPEVIRLAFNNFVESFVDSTLPIDRRAEEWKYSPSLVKDFELDVANNLFRKLPVEEQREIIEQWDTAYRERRSRKIATLSPAPR